MILFTLTHNIHIYYFILYILSHYTLCDKNRFKYQVKMTVFPKLKHACKITISISPSVKRRSTELNAITIVLLILKFLRSNPSFKLEDVCHKEWNELIEIRTNYTVPSVCPSGRPFSRNTLITDRDTSH